MDEGTESSARIDDRRLSARQLSLALLFGATVVVLAAWLLAGQPHLPAQWQADPGGQVRLVGAESQALHAHRAQALVGLRGADAELVVLDELILQRSPRWLVADEDRERHAAMHAAAAQAFAAPTAGLVFADGASVEAPMQRRGLAGLGTAFWLFTGLGLLLYMAVVALLLAQWSTRNLLFAVMSLCQLGNLAFAATESVAGLGLPILLRTLDMPARLAFDLVTAAAAVHAVALLYPRSRAIAARRLAAGAWCGAFLVIALGAEMLRATSSHFDLGLLLCARAEAELLGGDGRAAREALDASAAIAAAIGADSAADSELALALRRVRQLVATAPTT